MIRSNKYNMFPEELMRMIFVYLYDMNVSLFKFIMMSRTWARIGILILWQNPFKYCKKNNEKKDSLRKVICFKLNTQKDFFYNGEFPVKEHSSVLFLYLFFVRKINIQQIEEVFNEKICNTDIIVYTVIDLIFKSSNLIEKIHICSRSFYNILNLSEYMRNHEIYLSLHKTYSGLQRFENIKNITRLKVRDNHIHVLLQEIFGLENLKYLILINCLSYNNDDYLSIMKELKKLTYIKIISFLIEKDDAKYLFEKSSKYKNIKKIEIVGKS